MSADNGIFILHLRDQSRVIYALGIDNLWWSFVDMSMTPMLDENMISTRICEYYKDTLPMMKMDSVNLADRMAKEFFEDDEFGILEHGITEFYLDKTWDDIIKEAQILIDKELNEVFPFGKWESSRNELLELKKYLDKYYDTIIEE